MMPRCVRAAVTPPAARYTLNYMFLVKGVTIFCLWLAFLLPACQPLRALRSSLLIHHSSRLHRAIEGVFKSLYAVYDILLLEVMSRSIPSHPIPSHSIPTSLLLEARICTTHARARARARER